MWKAVVNCMAEVLHNATPSKYVHNNLTNKIINDLTI
jgi:hypothetical protein